MNEWRVIVVDDARVAREQLRMMLEDMGIHVVAEATNGQEVLDLLENIKADLVTMDIEMPVMDGIEATRQIIEHYPDVSILTVSSHANEKAIFAIEAGATWNLEKPVTPETLKAALEKIESISGHTKLRWDQA